MVGDFGNKKSGIRENPFERLDLRVELAKLEESLEQLRILYEQYFTGIMPLSPDKPHNEVKRLLRRLLKAPFKNSEMAYKLKVLEGRYHTLHSYWQRVMKQREEGTYSKDVFKAELRQRLSMEDQQASTAQGAAEKAMKNLYNSYRRALEEQSGRQQNLDYKAFQKAIMKQAKELKERHQGKKVSFKVVKNGAKISVQAVLKQD